MVFESKTHPTNTYSPIQPAKKGKWAVKEPEMTKTEAFFEKFIKTLEKDEQKVESFAKKEKNQISK